MYALFLVPLLISTGYGTSVFLTSTSRRSINFLSGSLSKVFLIIALQRNLFVQHVKRVNKQELALSQSKSLRSVLLFNYSTWIFLDQSTSNLLVERSTPLS